MALALKAERFRKGVNLVTLGDFWFTSRERTRSRGRGLAARSNNYVCRSNYLNERK
jgi:hypothetical protein